MTVLFTISDPRAELVRSIEQERRLLDHATTQKSRRWYSGRISAFKEALQTFDIFERNQNEDGNAVPMRSADEIIEEVKESV